MIDIKLIRTKEEEIKKALMKRMDNIDFKDLVDWDKRKRHIIQEIELLKAKKNKKNSQIQLSYKKGEPIEAYAEEVKELSHHIQELDAELSEIEIKINNFLEALPNIPDEDVPGGGKENNQIIREWGQKPNFEFTPKDHVELVTSLGLIDYKRGVKLSGKGFWLYKGYGALMEWGLFNYFIEEHLKAGYEFILPPHILNYQCGYTAGQFPKFEKDVFQLISASNKKEGEFKFLLPTAETALINLYQDEILKEDELPKKLFAYTPCYRREAGGYRTNERGMIRGHQFNKVELFQFTLPEKSEEALNELLAKAEKLVQGLGLHYRVSKLAANDCSAAMAKTYDIEVWIPSISEYKEVSSASNARDYQARRGNIRFKRKDKKKLSYVHTLNASGLATSRLIPAIVEQFQQQDGTVVVPEVLRKWVGKDFLGKK